MKRNIALTGFMGSGKSAVGKVLAGRLGRRFVELDDVIEEMAGKSIPDIFRQDGEIACGGGIVLNMINIDRLRETSRIVYLTASPEAVLRRTRADDNERPLLDVPAPAERIRELLRFRRPFYERAADLRISTSRLSTDSVAERIISQLKEDEGFNL